jgi:hypothetical protein
LRPDGRLIVIDLAHHERDDLAAKLAHRWPGFSDAAMRALLEDAGMQQGEPLSIGIASAPARQPTPSPAKRGRAGQGAAQETAPLTVRIWPAIRAADAAVAQPRELAV